MPLFLQSCGGECGNLGYLLHETAQALCMLPACPPQGNRSAGCWRRLGCGAEKHIWYTLCGLSFFFFFSPFFCYKYRWSWNTFKNLSLYKKKKKRVELKKKKNRTWGNFDFPSGGLFLLVQFLQCKKTPKLYCMRVNSDTAATPANLPKD